MCTGDVHPSRHKFTSKRDSATFQRKKRRAQTSDKSAEGFNILHRECVLRHPCKGQNPCSHRVWYRFWCCCNAKRRSHLGHPPHPRVEACLCGYVPNWGGGTPPGTLKKETRMRLVLVDPPPKRIFLVAVLNASDSGLPHAQAVGAVPRQTVEERPIGTSEPAIRGRAPRTEPPRSEATAIGP